MKTALLSLLLIVSAYSFANQDDAKIETDTTTRVEEKSDQTHRKIKKIIERINDKFGLDIDIQVEIDKLEDLGDLGEEIEQELEKELGSGHNVKIITNKGHRNHSGHRSGFGHTLISILALGFPLILLFLILFFSFKKRSQKIALLEQFIKTDKPIPQELMSDFNSGASNPLHKGLVLVAVGLALIIAFSVNDKFGVAAFGLIPLAMGVSRLIQWRTDEQ